ncbi:unnamed protein product [Rotaria magnacalcarata]|uniref:GOLD domain-containing protein n=1 Tax=Rotaria magnacalcarata TaxID=392030 RepID=A0A8S2KQC2_9BILA|nr:unnamed protein product [Rotaria magnacalcarata]
MLPWELNILLVSVILLLKKIYASELTFELPDNAKECFHDNLKIDSHFTLEFQVITGDWKVDGDPEHEITRPGPRVAESALTMIEKSVEKIHENLEKSIDDQTHHRLREATGRARAEDLNQRVQDWSLGQFLLIIFVAIGTVLLLRSFFSDRKTSNMTWNR